jgi:hypothetical protein
MENNFKNAEGFVSLLEELNMKSTAEAFKTEFKSKLKLL